MNKIAVKSALIFGAKDHIGRIVARYIKRNSPNTEIKVATHKKENLPLLAEMFPDMEPVHGDFLDPESLDRAVEGVEVIFQISPDVFHEDDLVNNMLSACSKIQSIKHIVRILGIPPGMSMSKLTPELRKFRYYPAMQHLVAVERYRDSGLPVTFVNVAGYFMDDFLRMFSPSLLERKSIEIAFNKRLAWVDHSDVAEVCGQILLSEPKDYVDRIIDVTGQDLFRFDQVAALFTKVLGVKVSYNDDEESFFRAIRPVFSQLWGDHAPEYFMKYFKWETEHQEAFKLTKSVGNILGREPKSFHNWIHENREFFYQAWSKNLSSIVT